MINLSELDIDTLMGQAGVTAIKEGLSRSIVSFGFYDKHIIQVETLIKEVGGSESRQEKDYYFIPMLDISTALPIAKALATLDFMQLPYPLMSERCPENPKEQKDVVEETKSEVSEEVGSESSEDQGPPKSVDKKPRKPRSPKEKPVETPSTVTEPTLSLETLKSEEPKNKFVGDVYDTAKQAHKDALILLLDKEFPAWRTMGKDKSKAMSASLVGEVFLDVSGVVVSSFKEKVAAYVKAALE